MKPQPLLLVVENDATVRRFVVFIVRSDGYQVIETATAAECVEILDAEAGVVDLIITDIIMARLGGLDLATEVERRYPKLKILYIFGYAASVAIQAIARKSASPDLAEAIHGGGVDQSCEAVVFVNGFNSPVVGRSRSGLPRGRYIRRGRKRERRWHAFGVGGRTERAEIDIRRRQMAASVFLIKALGGGWILPNFQPIDTSNGSTAEWLISLKVQTNAGNDKRTARAIPGGSHHCIARTIASECTDNL